MKVCTICNETKEIHDFLQDKSMKSGYRNQCKSCLKERNTTPEKKLLYATKQNEVMRRYRSTTKGAILTSFQACKGRSKKSDIPFTITREYVTELFEKQKGLCALTGVELIPKSGHTSPSLDKMNPKLGYVEGNVQWVAWKANAIKSDMTMEELYSFCETVLKLRC